MLCHRVWGRANLRSEQPVSKRDRGSRALLPPSRMPPYDRSISHYIPFLEVGEHPLPLVTRAGDSWLVIVHLIESLGKRESQWKHCLSLIDLRP